MDQPDDGGGIGQTGDGGAEIRRSGQPTRVPGHVLAGEPQSGLGAEMAEHCGIMREQYCLLFRQGRLIR